MKYKDIIKKIDSFSNRGIKPGLERIEYLLKKLSNPEDRLKVIHVAGTNGKGSVCSMLSSTLKESKLRVGLFKSPHIINLRERMQINNEMISEEDICKIFDKIYPVLLDMESENLFITQFELLTVMALVWFKEEACDIVILETGLGGRLDSTNIVKKSISVITSVSMDHTDILGDSIYKIAKEKAGIIKENSHVITTSNQKKEVLDIIEQESKKKKSVLDIIDINDFVKIRSDLTGSKIKYNGNEYFITLLGDHQIENFSIVIGVIEFLRKSGYLIQEDNIKNGLYNIFHPARLEILDKDPLIILDGAHNEGGATSISRFIKDNLGKKKIIAIVGMLRDKDYKSCMKIIAPLFSSIIFTSINVNSRGLDPNLLKQECLKYCDDLMIEENPKEALKLAKARAGKEDVIFICGSLYLSEEIYGG